MTSYVKDRTVAFVIDESVRYEMVYDKDGDEDTNEQEEDAVLIRKALRALNKKVGVRERIVLAVSKPERVYRIYADGDGKHLMHCVQR